MGATKLKGDEEEKVERKSKKEEEVAKPKQEKKLKRLAKNWYPVCSPPLFGEQCVAETLAPSADSMKNRVVSVPLSSLTGDFKHYHTKVFLRVTGVVDNKAVTAYDGQALLPDEISRMVHRWSSRIDSVDDIKTKDGVKVRIKSLTVTKRRVNSSVKQKIRALVSEMVVKQASSETLDDLVLDLINAKMQRAVSNAANKIYPVKGMSIRKTELL